MTGSELPADVNVSIKTEMVPGGSADLSDPLVGMSIALAKEYDLSTYLVALAAFQRGLAVTFHKSLPGSFFGVAGILDGRTGHLFSVTDGVRRVVFSRTLSNRLDPRVTNLTRDKHATKVRLAEAGIRVPRGILVEAGKAEAARAFVNSVSNVSFVVKPNDQSLGRGVAVDQSADAAIREILKGRKGKIVIEEFIPGREIRATVVHGRLVASLEKTPFTLIGDGVSSIKTLIDNRTLTRKNNPHFHKYVIEPERAVRHCVRRGFSVNSVIQRGETIIVGDTTLLEDGAERLDVSDLINDELAEFCVEACRRIGLETAGLDVIVSSDPRRPGAYCLEINARPEISHHSFPSLGNGNGNSVAEALIDYDFPSEGAQVGRFPTAAFNYGRIVEALQQPEFYEIRLPSISSSLSRSRMMFPDGALGAVRSFIAKPQPVFAFGMRNADGNNIFDIFQDLQYAPTYTQTG